MSNVRNSISLIGRIPATEKIKLTYKEAQDPKHNSIRGCLGVRRNFKKQEEKYYPEDLINFVAFGHTAKYINDYIGRGGQMAITGELRREDDWKDKDGQMHRGGLVVWVDDATKLGSEQTGSGNASQAVTQAPANPFATNANAGGAAMKNPFLSQKAIY